MAPPPRPPGARVKITDASQPTYHGLSGRHNQRRHLRLAGGHGAGVQPPSPSLKDPEFNSVTEFTNMIKDYHKQTTYEGPRLRRVTCNKLMNVSYESVRSTPHMRDSTRTVSSECGVPVVACSGYIKAIVYLLTYLLKTALIANFQQSKTTISECYFLSHPVVYALHIIMKVDVSTYTSANGL
jgi:hypothetical protein